MTDACPDRCAPDSHTGSPEGGREMKERGTPRLSPDDSLIIFSFVKNDSGPGGGMQAGSSEEGLDRPAVNGAVGPAVAVVDFGVRGDAERGIDRRQEIFRRHRVVLDVGGLLVGGAVDLAAADAA